MIGTILYLTSLVGSAGILIGLAIYAWRQRRETAVGPFTTAMLIGALWELCCGVQAARHSLEHQIFWQYASLIFLMFLMCSWMVMILSRAGKDGLLKGAYLWTLCSIPTVTIILILTSRYHHLCLYDFHLEPNEFVVTYRRGVWWFVCETYGYVLLLSSVVVFARSVARPFNAANRRELALVVTSVLIPLLADFVFQIGISPVPGVNLAPCTMALSGSLWGWAVFRYGTFELVPLVQRLLLETMPDAVFVLDSLGRLVLFNGAARKILGFDSKRHKGQPVEDVLAGWESLLARIEQGEVVSKEVVCEAAGRKAFYDLSIVPVINKSGLVLGRLIDLHDITKMKEAVAERERAEDQLRQIQKMEAVGQLAGGIAHDFNNILGASMMQISLMQNYPGVTPEMRSALQELEKGANRAAALTRQLLMFSRQQVMKVERLDLNDVLVDMLKMLGRILGEDIKLIVQAVPNLMWINADAGMIEQVIMNLCVNARDAMPNGGRITIGTEFRQITDTPTTDAGAYPGRFVCLSVADTGCGIEDQNQARIFEPFFTTKEVGKGTGLGLATVYGIVKQHHGWIEIESKVGEGSVFRVYLPACDGAPATKNATASNHVPRGHETILFVEDDESLRGIVGLGLKDLGYDVIEAGNGVDALQRWNQSKDQVAMLLTDMVMPEGMTGLHLAKQLKQESPKLKVVISSGYSLELSQLQENTDLGFTYLNKPYQVAALATVVRECLDRPTVLVR